MPRGVHTGQRTGITGIIVDRSSDTGLYLSTNTDPLIPVHYTGPLYRHYYRYTNTGALIPVQLFSVLWGSGVCGRPQGPTPNSWLPGLETWQEIDEVARSWSSARPTGISVGRLSHELARRCPGSLTRSPTCHRRQRSRSRSQEIVVVHLSPLAAAFSPLLVDRYGGPVEGNGL
jgi:hypothetical protein